MKSMTGYAALDRDGRRWEVRSVNARGLDLRLRLPDVPGLEPLVRKAVAGVAARGNVTLSLRLGEGGAAPRASLDPEALDAAVAAIAAVRVAAAAQGVPLADERAAAILSLRGVYDIRDTRDEVTLEDLSADLEDLLAAFKADRTREGDGLRQLLSEQIDAVEALTERAVSLADLRDARIAETFRTAIARLVAEGLDEARVAHDVAALAIKADVTEELGRLALHVAAARELLAADGPVGRQIDFLTQEFNREANTLCAKSGLAETTAIGLDLKTAIDRLREQVQNVE